VRAVELYKDEDDVVDLHDILRKFKNRLRKIKSHILNSELMLKSEKLSLRRRNCGE